MGGRVVPAAAAIAAAALAPLLLVTGCAAPAPGAATGDPKAAAEAVAPAADPRPWPDGASASTPPCQNASPAVLAAVNATIDNPLPDDPDAVSSLTASPDPDNAVWLLTGVIGTGTPSGSEDETDTEHETGTEGYLVAWATTADPTLPTFSGALRSVGATTANLSSAPLLQVPASAPGGLPSAALACASVPGAALLSDEE